MSKYALSFAICVLAVAAGVFTILNPQDAARRTVDKQGVEQSQVTKTYTRFLDRLPGAYSNRAQYATADESLKIKPKIGDTRPWIDYQYAVFKRVDIPGIPGDDIVLQWRVGGPNGEVSRQRLWAFQRVNDQVKMDFYSFLASIDFDDNAVLTALTPQMLISYGEKCALPLRRVDGALHFSIPDTCRIISRSGRDMVLSAEITFDGGLKYRESGRLIDGSPIFEVPGGRSYDFVRVGD